MEKLPIGYTFVLVDEMDKRLVLNGDFKSAICNVYEEVIYISKALINTVLREIVVHELTHAVISKYLPDRKIYGNDEEWLCSFMGLYAHEIVKNADLAIAMIEEEKAAENGGSEIEFTITTKKKKGKK